MSCKNIFSCDKEILFLSRNTLLRLRYHYCKLETLLFILTLVADKRKILAPLPPRNVMSLVPENPPISHPEESWSRTCLYLLYSDVILIYDVWFELKESRILQ